MKREQTKAEERLNTWSHGLGALTAVAGLVILVISGASSDVKYSLFSGLFYGISLVITYTSSAIYHHINLSQVKNVFRIIDHSCIFLLIAGTYTPFLLITIGGSFGWTFFGIQWGLALIGIILKIFFTGRFEALSLTMYAVMGWIIVVRLGYLIEVMPSGGFWLLVSGGLSYTFGIIFYALDHKIPYGHFIWHLFVLGGSMLHYLSVILFVY